MKYNLLILLAFISLAFISCEPYIEDTIDLPPLPDSPEFTVVPHPDNPNKVVVSFTSDTFFDHLWSFPGGTPASSSLSVDTVFYQKAGTHEISLHASAIGGGGTSSSSQNVIIEEDAVILCDEDLTLLTDECTVKCWTLSQAPASIVVGPEPLSAEWFASSGLDGAQLDDGWCFEFEGAVLRYENNGNTFSACANYSVVEDYPIPPNMTYNIVPSNSDFSSLKIILPEDFWMGVEDSGNEYEIHSLTENEMVLLTPIAPCDGSPSNGWFTLTFVPQ